VLRDPHQQPLERPPLPPGTPQRLILNEEQAAEFLNMPRPKFREMASKGAIPRLSYGLRRHPSIPRPLWLPHLEVVSKTRLGTPEVLAFTM
jgi:hypothetical protein